MNFMLKSFSVSLLLLGWLISNGQQMGGMNRGPQGQRSTSGSQKMQKGAKGAKGAKRFHSF